LAIFGFAVRGLAVAEPVRGGGIGKKAPDGQISREAIWPGMELR
jgi:hypothetical protein